MTHQNNDPYAALGISPDATEDEIHGAYRRLAKRYHPDLHPGTRAGERMRTINQAWTVLSRPTASPRYDAHRPGPRTRGGSSRRSSRGTAGAARVSEQREGNELNLGWPALVLALLTVCLVFVGLVVGFLPPFLLVPVVLLSARGILGRA
jgi:molecular chaperone DnaJ